MQPQVRYYAIDNLRAIIMWLGVVLHVAVNHLAGESLLPWRDSATTHVADITAFTIHIFRMPLFFILAGFFVALLVERYGAWGMLKHRLKRLGLPFLVFFPIVFISIAVLVLMYLNVMNTGVIGLNPEYAPPPPENGEAAINTMHLWFLYYLIWMCIFAAPVYRFIHSLSEDRKKHFSGLFEKFATQGWGIVLLTLPLALVGMNYEHGIITPTGSLIPNVNELVHNGIFFAFGCFIYPRRENLLTYFRKYTWHYSATGIVLYFGFLIFFELRSDWGLEGQMSHFVTGFYHNLLTWVWCFTLIGLFERFVNTPNRVLRYLSDSSYWVYIIHMIFTMGFGVLLYNTELSALAKMGINIAATSLVGLVSYHFLVRNSFIGLFLNGKKHKVKQEPTTSKPRVDVA